MQRHLLPALALLLVAAAHAGCQDDPEPLPTQSDVTDTSSASDTAADSEDARADLSLPDGLVSDTTAPSDLDASPDDTAIAGDTTADTADTADATADTTTPPTDTTTGDDTTPACLPPQCCTQHSDCVAPQTCQPDGSCGDQPGPVFDVPHGGIADHADPGAIGSLAWRLQFLAAGQSARLVDTAPAYVTQSKLVVPSGVALLGISGAQRPRLQAGAGLQGKPMLELRSNTVVEHLVLDGGYQANHIVVASDTSDVRITDSVIERTRNDWPAGSDPRCHGVVAARATNLVIETSTLQDFGYPKQSPRDWPGVCAAIYAPENVNMTIDQNTIQRALTAGIDFTATLGASITANTIARTGRNIEYWVTDYDLPVADGITAYSNEHGFTYQDLHVVGNTVSDSGNHGIHLSGRDLHVLDNVITSPFAQGIIIDDHRAPADCASNVFIERNQVSGLLSGGERHAVYIGRDHKPGAFSIKDNTPDDVYWRPGAECL